MESLGGALKRAGSSTAARVAYEDLPTASFAQLTFVCAPGLGDVRQEYRNLVPLLSQHGRVIVTDLRGLGDSDTTSEAISPDDCARDLMSIVEAESLQAVVFVGCSMTGASVLYAARQLNTSATPHRVQGCILINPFAWDHPMPCGLPTLLWCLLNRWTGPGFWLTYYKGLYPRAKEVNDLDGYCAALQQHLGSDPKRINALAEQVRLGHSTHAVEGLVPVDLSHASLLQMFGSKSVCESALPDLASSRLPVLALYGSKDPDFADPKAEAQEMVARLGAGPKAAQGVDQPSHAVFEIIEGCGHYPHVEDPAAVMAAIQKFLTGKVHRH